MHMNSVYASQPQTPCPHPFNMAQYVLENGGATPAKDALQILSETSQDTWSYAAITGAVQRVAMALDAYGITQGDIVMLRIGNSVAFPIVYLACIARGIVPVPTSSQLTQGEVRKLLDQVKCKAIVQEQGVASPQFDLVVQVDALDINQSALPDPDFAYDMGDPNRLAYIVFTSGTSGTPRAVAHAHRAIWARRMMHEGWYGLTPNDRLMHAGAFNWTFTLGTGLMDPWSVGATAIIAQDGTPIEALPALLHRSKASIFAAAPGVLRKLIRTSHTLDLPDLRHALAAGEKLSPDVNAAWEKATGTQVYEAYGQSECSTFISASPSRPAPIGTLGYPQIGRHIAILGPDGPVEHGVEGTIAIHKEDAGLMLGYHNAPEATEAKYQGEWFLTGDMGQMAQDGAITYLGRDDDMMNAGGYRVSPLEIEAALIVQPEINQVAVTDVEIKRDVKVIAAFYVSDVPLDPAQLEGYASEQLAAYKRPKLYRRVDALPLGGNGKILRKALRDNFEMEG